MVCYFAQQALVHAADAVHFSAEQPSAAQHSQSAHDVQPHGQSAGQQQPPANSAETLPLAATGLSIDSPANMATITSRATTTAVYAVRDIEFLRIE